jgi:phage tail sheath protein FI
MPTTSSYLNRKTPGIYVTEIDAFGSSIVGVPTAVPIFIGYTQFAGDPVTGRPLYQTPVPIASLTEFSTYFGGPALHLFEVERAASTPNPLPPSFMADYTDGAAGSYSVASRGFDLHPVAGAARFSLYWQMRLFFANGGGNCYVVSVGSYWADQLPVADPLDAPVTDGWASRPIAADDLTLGIAAAGYAVGPTMIVVPESCTLDAPGYRSVAGAMLTQAAKLQDRVAILDLPGCLDARTLTALQACQADLADAIEPAIACASYGVAYAPAVAASVIDAADLLFTNLQGSAASQRLINNLLTTQACCLYPPSTNGPALATLRAAIATAFPTGLTPATNTPQYSGDASGFPPPTDGATGTLRHWRLALDNLLTNALPIYKQMKQLIAVDLNVQAPSGAMAGVWTKNDAQSGVWNAPANMALASVVGALCPVNDTDQAGFSVPTNGQSINILRDQSGRGTVVWGARTLDGNSTDYRYIQARRTLIYIEQSIKTALQNYVFAANDAVTWQTVTASISSFLTGLWQQGGLMGSKTSDAFTVRCGLGSTMTAQDVLNGYMVVAITVQLIAPAEFIELTFTQTMGS